MPLQFPFRDLTQQYISLSYQDVVQRYTQTTASYFLDGLGFVIGFIPAQSLGQQIMTADIPSPPSVSASYALTASFALNGGGGGGNSDSASWASHSFTSETSSFSFFSIFADTASLAIESIFADTASLAFFANFAGSASYSITASNANTASYALIANSAISASHAVYSDSASIVISASYAQTASTVNITTTNTTASYFITFVSGSGTQFLLIDTTSIFYNPGSKTLWTNHISASTMTCSFVQGTSSYALNTLSASYATTCSVFIFSNITESFIQTSFTTQSLFSTQSLFATQSVTASYANTASYVLNASPTISASWASQSLSASYSLTSTSASNTISSSYADLSTYADQLFVNDTVANGAFLFPIIASDTYTRFYTDVATQITYNPALGRLIVPQITSSLQGSASYASTASFALNSSPSISSSWASQSLSSSNATTASFAFTSSFAVYQASIASAPNNSTSSIISILNSIYNSMFVNYVLTDTQNFRAGNIVVLYTTSSTILSETCTTDIGNNDGLQFSASLSASYVNLSVVNLSNSNYSVKYHYDTL